jgi:hypothetical protein
VSCSKDTAIQRKELRYQRDIFGAGSLRMILLAARIRRIARLLGMADRPLTASQIRADECCFFARDNRDLAGGCLAMYVPPNGDGA